MTDMLLVSWVAFFLVLLIAVNVALLVINWRDWERNRRTARRTLECMQAWEAMRRSQLSQMPYYRAGGGWVIAGEVGPEDELLGAYLVEIRRN